MKVLCVTNMYPSISAPFEGTFVEQQVKGLKEIWLNVVLFYLPRVARGMKVYFSMSQAKKFDFGK